MAYIDDVTTISPDHVWTLDGSLTDSVGSVTLTNSGGSTTGSGLCVDATNSWVSNTIAGDRLTMSSTTDINNATHTIKAVGGWFSTDSIQPHPCRIYGEGTNATTFQFVMGMGNNTMLEAVDSTGGAQVYGISLVPDRAYHLMGLCTSGTLEMFVDGVSQGTASGYGTTLNARSDAVFADPSATVGVGGDVVLLQAATDGSYNYWGTWEGVNPTSSEIRTELFEKGAVASLVVTNQAGMDSIADTVRPNVPCCIEVTGNGTIDLSADNITFDILASLHVKYSGTGTLNWTNTNGSDASIGATTGGGTINFINPATFTIDGVINGSEVRIYDNEVVNTGNNDTELAGIESNVGTSFVYAHDGVSNEVVIQIMATGYVEIKKVFTLGSADQLLTVFPETEVN